MKIGKWLLFLTVFALTGCSSVTTMTSSRMNMLELGMSKKQVINILGTGYTIAEKRIEKGADMEILSYRDFYRSDEFYLFHFVNGKLEKWYRELLPEHYKMGKRDK